MLEDSTDPYLDITSSLKPAIHWKNKTTQPFGKNKTHTGNWQKKTHTEWTKWKDLNLESFRCQKQPWFVWWKTEKGLLMYTETSPDHKSSFTKKADLSFSKNEKRRKKTKTDETTERKKWDERESKVWSEEKPWWEVLQQIHSYVTVKISICSV